MTATSVAKYFHMKGSTVERYYKDKLSDFSTWDQAEHAKEWVLLPENIGEFCGIDETMLAGEVYTIFFNKDGHGRRGTIIAIVKGTKADVVASYINRIPLSEREKVKEITMDFSDSMYSIAKQCLPNATIIIDCFHIIQRICEGLDELRLRFKRLAVTQTKKEEAEFKKEEEKKAKRRLYCRLRYAEKRADKKKPKGKKRERKRIRMKKFRPTEFSNGDTKVELYTRSRGLLYKAGGKWSSNQKDRAKILFKECPKIKEGYSLVCSVRSIFSDKNLNREQAKEKLHKWYGKVANCNLREIKFARDCIKAKEEEVLNYFDNRATNAATESLNSKLKGFKAQLHGVVDIPFFMYRVCMIFG